MGWPIETQHLHRYHPTKYSSPQKSTLKNRSSEIEIETFAMISRTSSITQVPTNSSTCFEEGLRVGAIANREVPISPLGVHNPLAPEGIMRNMSQSAAGEATR
jgi:hypothetical protein